MYNIGAIISVLGAFGLFYKYISKEAWNEVLNTIIENRISHSHIVFGLADVLPLILIIVGGALMLKARHET
jgi:hypothetical protein